jgi:flagellar biosynthesis/type III secretory pathway protein FliH
MTVTVDQPTVTVQELARALGVAPLEEDLVGHARAHGVLVHVIRDWSGRPAVTAGDAAALVAASEARANERAAAKSRSQAEQDAAIWAREREIATAARSAYERVLAAGARHGDRNAELRAWMAGLTAGLERQAQLAEANQPAATEPTPRRWWQR